MELGQGRESRKFCMLPCMVLDIMRSSAVCAVVVKTTCSLGFEGALICMHFINIYKNGYEIVQGLICS